MSTTTLDEKVATALQSGEITEYEAQHPETVPALYVETAGRRTAEAVAELVTIADLVDGEQVLEEMGHGRIAKALDIHEAEVEELSADDLREQADEYLREWPLCIEASTTFEIVLGTGGPDTRLMIECDRVEMNSVAIEQGRDRWSYEVRRVFYRYSWFGSADFELTGDDRAAAEAFARRVVPELLDA